MFFTNNKITSNVTFVLFYY